MGRKKKAATNFVPSEVMDSGSDEWALETTNYDPSNFYVTNHKGSETQPVAVRLPLSMHRAVDELLTEGRIFSTNPYRTPSDFLRDAVVHRMVFLKGKMANPTKLNTMLQSILQAEHLLYMEETASRLASLLNDRLDSLVQIIDPYTPAGRTEARRILDKLLAETDGMDPFWGQWARAKITAKYGFILTDPGEVQGATGNGS